MSQAGFPINIFDYFELNDSGSVTCFQKIIWLVCLFICLLAWSAKEKAQTVLDEIFTRDKASPNIDSFPIRNRA